MKRNYLILIAIGLIGLALRLWQISALPSGLTWDEAALGYNAYSVLKTGRGEHGHLFPLIFTSFGDYKPGLYIYTAVPFVAIFGLNEFSTRLPSVLAGTLTIFLVYFLTQNLLGKKYSQATFPPGLWSALALAINPWHIHFSRGAWEVNLFVALLTASLWLLLKSFQNKRMIIPAVIFATLTLFTYQAAKMLTPLLWLLTVLIFWPQTKQLVSKIKQPLYLSTLAIITLITLFLLYLNLTGSAGNRLNRLSLFNYHPDFTQSDKQIDQNNQLVLNLFHGQFDLLYHSIASRYFYHFSPEVLFYEGPVISDRGHIPHMGMLYITDIVWLVMGAYFVLHLKKSRIVSYLFLLLFLSPLPASLTLSEFSTTRALFMVIPLCIFTGLGLYEAVRKWPKLILIVIFPLYLLNVWYGLDLYFFHSQKVQANEFNYGYKQAVQKIQEIPAKKVVFTDVLGQPYIYYLFYTKYDPRLNQLNNDFTDSSVDVGKVGRVGKVEFHQFAASEIFHNPDTLYIGSIGNIPDDFNSQDARITFYDQIFAPDGHIIFRIVKTK